MMWFDLMRWDRAKGNYKAKASVPAVARRYHYRVPALHHLWWLTVKIAH
jgi:hypothetical protein